MNSYKKIIALLLIAAILTTSGLTILTNRAEAETNSITWLQENKILNNNFDISKIQSNPDKAITRQEFVSLLMQTINQKGTKAEFKKLKYDDKNKVEEKLQGYMASADKLGVLLSANYKGKVIIKPTRELTRRMASYYLGKVIGVEIGLDPVMYEDYEKIGAKTSDFVMGVTCADLTDWGSDGLLVPKAAVTWEEAAELIQRAYNKGYFTMPAVTIVAGEVKMNSTEDQMEFQSPSGVSVHSGNEVYVADTDQNVIKVIKDRKTSILAGKLNPRDESNTRIGGYVDGKLEEAVFHKPTGICVVNNGLLVADSGNHSIRFIDLSNGTVETLAGNGRAGYQNGLKSSVQFDNPQGIVISDEGIIYVTDTDNDCIRMIDKNGTVSTFAGIAGTEGYLDGKAEQANFNGPTGMAYHKGILYVVDTGNQRIRKIENGMVSTVAGSGTELMEGTKEYVGGYQDGAALKALFDGPIGIAVDQNGVIYISDSVNQMIRFIKDGEVGTLAGFGNLITNKTRQWENYIVSPYGLAISDQNNSIYVSDSFNNMIMRIPLIR